jgi:hypothetical protein
MVDEEHGRKIYVENDENKDEMGAEKENEMGEEKEDEMGEEKEDEMGGELKEENNMKDSETRQDKTEKQVG